MRTLALLLAAVCLVALARPHRWPPGVGPQATITCPAGAVAVSTSANLQTAVDSHASGTTFCLAPGVHPITAAITPKSGDVFIGAYGAILDGTGWTTTDPNQGAFRAHNQDIDDVTIRNLVIRHMPQRGIHALSWMSDRWTIDYNEVTATQVGLSVPSHSLIRHNAVHDNTQGAYLVWKASQTTFDGNDFSYNGGGQKVVGSSSVTFRNNVVHHNVSDGIWFDTDNLDALVENNRVEDNGRDGVSHETSGRAIIRANMIRRNGGSGIFISTSKDVAISGNTLDSNYRGIQLFLNCAAVGGGTIGVDLVHDTATDNVVTVGTATGALANGVSYSSSCTATQVAPYLAGQKALTFDRNHYTVPADARYWMWGLSVFKSWADWQAVPQDVAGTMVIR